jgi:seryl-tRNA synthetase
MENDYHREKKMQEHHRVGKCMKKDVQSKEKEID